MRSRSVSAPKGTAARLSSGEGANWLRYAPPVDLPPLDSEADGEWVKYIAKYPIICISE